MLSDTRTLLETLNLEVSFNLPCWSMSDNPDKMALVLRKKLGISITEQIEQFGSHVDAQNVWRDKLFDHGVIVRICEMPIIDARAFCLFGSGLAGIGLSNEDREHGRIFSLFHEVCHLALNMPGISGIVSRSKSENLSLEQYCDHFSAAFLLPETDTLVDESLKLFQDSSIDFLELSKHVANKFKVSKYVALRRAFDLGYVTDNIYWQLIYEWKEADKQFESAHKASFGNYNVTQVNYVGKRFLSLVMQAFESNQLTSVEVRRILGVSPTTIEACNRQKSSKWLVFLTITIVLMPV
jgi:Zn-dependent peptidase ImmA (M78 family)